MVDTQGHKQTASESAQAKQQAAQAKADRELHNGMDMWTLRWSALTALATTALVLVGIAGTIAALCTLREIQKQTQVNRDAAIAARLSAEAIQHSERAWITALPHIWSPEFYPLWEKGDPIPDGPMGLHPVVHKLPLQIKNTGKTPARIDSIAASYDRILIHPSELPAEPTYGEFSPQNGYLLVPNDEMLLDIFLSHNRGMMRKEEITAIRNQEAFLYVYGIVRYRDVYENPRESRFGYIYHSPRGGAINFEKAGFRQGGPVAYNRST